MAAPPTRIDWHQIGRLPAVRAIAGAVHERWGVWTGLVTQAGLTVSSLAPGQVRRISACDRFMNRSDQRGSCQVSLRGWAGATGSQRVGCHAHFEAEVVPVGIGDASGACLYASGFLGEERQFEHVAALLDRAEELDIPRAEMASTLDAIPRLGETDRMALRTLLESMAGVIRREIGRDRPPPPIRHDYSPIVGCSPQILRLFAVVDRVVGNDSTVLIQGANGTGKELFARAIHTNSRRRQRPFVTQNCSALNDNLLESELFGHRKGAFTGAIADKRGLFELADGGTLLLDEVGDMSPSMQVKLLRVLQERTFTPVGATVQKRVDVRVIAATHRELREMVREGRFREDLFYRLNVIRLVVPPLRERREDIPLLAEHFAAEYAQRTGRPIRPFSDEVLQIFQAYAWPGNVRELRHEVERLVVLSDDGPVIEAQAISARILEEARPHLAPVAAGQETQLPLAIEALERRMILSALDDTGWNKTHAARKLGISRRNLIRKVQSYELVRPERD